jgi:nicotinate phosphoribosyltransferase
MAIINSLLDTDWYKLTMGQTAHFAEWTEQSPMNREVTYTFTNRGGTFFPQEFLSQFKSELEGMSKLRLTDSETAYLSKFTFFHKEYIDWFRTYQFNPNEVSYSLENGKFNLSIKGPWFRTIYWEVPLLALISELYYRVSNCIPDLNRATERIEEKIKKANENGILLVDFGTRRRFSHAMQDLVVTMFKENCKTFGGRVSCLGLSQSLVN